MSRPLPSGSNELPSKFGVVSALEYICKSRTLVSLRFSIPSASHTHLAFRASRYSPKAYGKSLSKRPNRFKLTKSELTAAIKKQWHYETGNLNTT